MSNLKMTLTELSRALQDLHRELLMLQSKRLEDESGRKHSPYELLHASLHDPNFNWLRQLSALIVTIDTTVDETPNLSGKESNEIASAVLNLLEKAEDAPVTEFWAQYSKHLALADVIMKHSRVKSVVAQLRPKM